MNAKQAIQWLMDYGSDINDPESTEKFARALSTLITELGETKRWSQFHDLQAQRMMHERDEARAKVQQAAELLRAYVRQLNEDAARAFLGGAS